MSKTRIRIAGLTLAVTLVGITGIAQAAVLNPLVELVAADNPTTNHNNNEWATTGNSTLSGMYTTAGSVNRPNLLTSSTATQGNVTSYDAAGVTAGFGMANATGQPDLRVGDFSWEMWLRRTGGIKNTEHSIARLRANGTTQYMSLFVKWNDAGEVDAESIDIDFRGEAGSNIRHKFHDVLTLPQRATTDDFDHLVVTFDNNTTTDNLKLYLNNASPVTLSANVTYDTNVPLDDGAIFHLSDGEAARGFNGQIAVVRVYGDVLTPQEVSSNFNLGPQAVPEPATMALLGIGGLMVLIVLRRRRSA